jgi:hypothetical protein
MTRGFEFSIFFDPIDAFEQTTELPLKCLDLGSAHCNIFLQSRMLSLNLRELIPYRVCRR